ncbi:MAG TPA: GNAT family N-acetyltransferase [Streptosporangiaceae bacterium]|nr:GNAT family N-acetyltransferase [Streptosporangiaceae bacterium]
MPDGEIAIDDPRSADIRELLERHLTFAHTHTPPKDVHALDIDGLLDPAVTFYSYRLDGQLLAVGALKQLDLRHAELKSMHTVQGARGRGIGRAMLNHLIAVARNRGYLRVSLETGTMEAFTPARSLYASAGFEPCGPFADYSPSPSNTYMTLSLAGADSDAGRPAGRRNDQPQPGQPYERATGAWIELQSASALAAAC